MGRALAVVVLLATVVAGASASPSAYRCGDQKQFGYVRSLVQVKGRWQLRFDPAFMWTGVTASAAAHEKTVPNDFYVVDESPRTYLFYVSPTARVTVLTPKQYFDGVPVPVATLARLVAGERPLKLFEPLSTGFWMQYGNDTVCALAQQYRP